MAASGETSDRDSRDARLTLAEIGGALSDDELEHAERLTLELLGDIRREKQEGGQ